MNNIEVEIRSFISEEKYLELIEHFNKEAKLIKLENDITEYYADQGAVRLWQNEKEAKIILKTGDIHDEQREEHEIIIKKEDFQIMQKMFKSLEIEKYSCLVVSANWKRTRYTFMSEGITIQLGDNVGYGHIIELEIMSSPESKDKSIEILRKKLADLNIPITPKEEFKASYENYKTNWKTLLKEN